MAIINSIPKGYFDRFKPRTKDGLNSSDIRNNFIGLGSGDFLPLRPSTSVIIDSHDFGTDIGASTTYSGTGVTVTTNKTNPHEGIACLQAVVDVTGNRQIIRLALTAAIDISSFVKLGVWTRCNTTSSAIQFILRDGSGNESYWNITTSGTVDTWQQSFLTIAAPDSNNGTAAVLTNITSYGYKGLDASITYLFDEIIAYLWSMNVYINPSYIGSYFYGVYSGTTIIKYDGGVSPAIALPASNARISLISYNPDPQSAETSLMITHGATKASPNFSDIPACPDGDIPICAIYVPSTAAKVVEYHQIDAFTTDAYIFADLRQLYGGSSGTGTVNRYVGTFVNGDLSAGVLTVLHGLTATTVSVSVKDNEGNTILPDEITESSGNNSVSIDLSSYGTIVGTWEVLILG